MQLPTKLHQHNNKLIFWPPFKPFWHDFCLSCTSPVITVNGDNSENSGRGRITCSVAIWQQKTQYHYVFLKFLAKPFINETIVQKCMNLKCRFISNNKSECNYSDKIYSSCITFKTLYINWIGKHPNDWKKKPSNSNCWQLWGWNAYSWGPTKICHGSDTSSRVSLTILAIEEEICLRTIYMISSKEKSKCSDEHD